MACILELQEQHFKVWPRMADSFNPELKLQEQYFKECLFKGQLGKK